MYRLILITLYLTATIVRAHDDAWNEKYDQNRANLSSLTILFKNQQFECFGAIFSRNLILTSAKCIRGIAPTQFKVEVDLLAPNNDEPDFYRGRHYFAYDAIFTRISESENNKNDDEVIDDIAFLVTEPLDLNYRYVKRSRLPEDSTYALSVTSSFRQFTLNALRVNRGYFNFNALNVYVTNETTPSEVYIDLPTEIGTFIKGRFSNATQKIKVDIRTEKECFEESQTNKQCDKVLKGKIANNQVVSRGAPVTDDEGNLIGIVSDVRPESNVSSELSITKISFAMPHLVEIIDNLQSEYLSH